MLDIRRALSVSAAAALTAGTIAIAPAAQAAPMHMTPKIWHVYSSLHDQPQSVQPGGTYTACLTEDVSQLYLKVKVTHAKKDKRFSVIWKQDGQRLGRYLAAYGSGGSFTDWFSWPNAARGTLSLSDGTYSVTFKQAGKKVGGNKVTLEHHAC